MPITITPHAEGATLAVRAQPGARKNAVLGEQAGALKVAVTAPPEDGRANAALVPVSRMLGKEDAGTADAPGGQHVRLVDLEKRNRPAHTTGASDFSGRSGPRR